MHYPAAGHSIEQGAQFCQTYKETRRIKSELVMFMENGQEKREKANL